MNHPSSDKANLTCLFVASSRKIIEETIHELMNFPILWTTCLEIEAAKALLSIQKFDLLIVHNTCGKNTPSFSTSSLNKHTSAHYPNTSLIELECSSECAQLTYLRNKIEKIISSTTLELSQTEPNLNQPVFYSSLNSLIADNPLTVHYQPILDLNQLKIIGYECLVRLQGEYKHWSPEMLFAYAAKKDQILEVDTLCVLQGLSHLHRKSEEFPLFINVRPRSLTNSALIDLLEKSVPKNKRHLYTLELTEQQKIINYEALLDSLCRLKKLGFKLAIDDFGAGFSNLQLIHDIDPDFIKLSGIFSKDLHKSARKQSIISTVVHLGKKLSTPIIIESLETKEDLDTASKLGIQFGQGYYFSKAVPLQEIGRGKLLYERGFELQG